MEEKEKIDNNSVNNNSDNSKTVLNILDQLNTKKSETMAQVLASDESKKELI